MPATAPSEAAQMDESAPASRGRPRRQSVSWRLAAHVMREILKTFFFVLAILELSYSILSAVGAAQAAQLDLPLVLPIFWFTAVSMLNDSIPLALVFATSLVFGRFIADREVMAWKSFGMSYRQILTPAIVLGLVFTGIGVWINGYLGPEMYEKRRDIGRLIVSQFRYLGEGSHRDFSFRKSPWNLWIRRYDGRHLEGIFLSRRTDAALDEFLPEEMLESVDQSASLYYIYAERGRVLFPEEVAEEAGIEPSSLLGEGEKAHDPRSTIIIELRDISVFFSDALHSGGTGNFLQRMHLGLRRVAIPLGRESRGKRRKEMVNGELRAHLVELAERARDPAETEDMRRYWKREHLRGQADFHERWSRTAVCFLFPVLAGLIALWLNSDNRLLPFFIASTALPGLFYGLSTLGQVLPEAGVPPWLTGYAAPFSLLVASGVLWWLLDRKVLR